MEGRGCVWMWKVSAHLLCEFRVSQSLIPIDIREEVVVITAKQTVQIDHFGECLAMPLNEDVDFEDIDFQCNEIYYMLLQMYPTRVRSFALGLNNSMARVGAILSPFISVGLTKSGYLTAAEAIIAGSCSLAAICIPFLPHEKAGRSLEVFCCYQYLR